MKMANPAKINNSSVQPMNFDRTFTSASIPIEASPLYSPLFVDVNSSPKILSFDSPKSELIKKERWKRSSLQEIEANLEEINNHERLSKLSEDSRPIIRETIGYILIFLKNEK